MPLLLVATALCCASPAARAGTGRCKFPAVFNFGDSNSDTGGFWAAFPAQQGPFGMTYFGRPAGRASDGHLVIDLIGTYLLPQAMGLPLPSPYLQSIGSDYRHGANFATLASTVLLPNTSVFVTGTSPFLPRYPAQPDERVQEQSARLQRQQRQEGSEMLGCFAGQLPRPDVFGNALYTIDIGQNDFTSNLGSLGVESVKRNVPSIVNQISWTIQDLYNIRARNFMVFNMAPVGCYPAFLTELPHNSNDLDEFGCMKSYNSGATYYNELLNSSLAEVRKKLQDASVVNSEAVNGTRACCGYGGGTYNFNQDVYCRNSKVVNGKTATAGACGDPQNYVSWDGIHATQAANNKIAYAVISASYSYPPFDLSKLCSP
ncbi:unnamed protein product [Miscanthus lutarioriparius]|uniref:GDSL esterase/lipase n=1 Tax=Miscanthus lutarioriparius TaxID=422564 RepID=A0A811S9M7_9POAL|nr:unnamed protein product [Miscanthus lutarioriparius]